MFRGVDRPHPSAVDACKAAASDDSFIVLGCGYVGSRIARAALAEGRTVRVCARSTGKLAPLGALGAEVKYLDAGIPKQLPLACREPGRCDRRLLDPAGDEPAARARRCAPRCKRRTARAAADFIYFSSSGLYGAGPDDDVWIDEDTPLAHDDPGMKNVISDENEIAGCSFDRLRLVTLRLAPVYGPGRGVRNRI